MLRVGEDWSRIKSLKAWGDWYDLVPGSLVSIDDDRIAFRCPYTGNRFVLDRYVVRIYAEKEAAEVNPSG